MTGHMMKISGLINKITGLSSLRELAMWHVFTQHDDSDSAVTHLKMVNAAKCLHFFMSASLQSRFVKYGTRKPQKEISDKGGLTEEQTVDRSVERAQ